MTPLGSVYFHHRWFAQGPLWFLCADCRRTWGSRHPGWWRQLVKAVRPGYWARRRNVLLVNHVETVKIASGPVSVGTIGGSSPEETP